MDLKAFERFAKVYEPGTIIFLEHEPGDSFYLIQEGSVKIVKLFGSIEKTIDILKAGEFFGEMAILEGAPRSATIIAEEKCKLLEFNKANFGVLMKGNPQIAVNLLKIFSKRIYDQKRRFLILTLEDDLAKVADVFIMLHESRSQQLKQDDDFHTGKVEFKTSVNDIAHWAGIAPNSCQKLLTQLQNQRRIEVYQNRIVVSNINELMRFVNSKRKLQETQEN